jgi:hypothetical protein
MSDVIHRSNRDFDVVLEIICEWSAIDDEFDRVVIAVKFTVAATLCWIIFDIISRITTWIIFWIFWSERFCYCCFLISISLDEKEIMKCDNSLCFLKASEWRFFSFFNMIFETSSRVLLNNDIFLNNSVKFWEYSDDTVKSSANDFVMFLNWSVKSFFLFFRKKIWVVCTFDDKFFDNLNKTRINSFYESLFLNEISNVVDRIDCDVLDVFAIAFINENLNCS